MSFHLAIEDAKKELAKQSKPFVLLMKEKNMSIEYFASF